jgi:hypothetical protein
MSDTDNAIDRFIFWPPVAFRSHNSSTNKMTVKAKWLLSGDGFSFRIDRDRAVRWPKRVIR